ncbi:hypothetical protein GGR56DRAFT_694136 [Xylariaceae sp. FL0804]|nr:hypothetical protein GGR56DRAFT_694136 [Xylariaceae sp. FL0804]
MADQRRALQDASQRANHSPSVPPLRRLSSPSQDPDDPMSSAVFKEYAKKLGITPEQVLAETMAIEAAEAKATARAKAAAAEEPTAAAAAPKGKKRKSSEAFTPSSLKDDIAAYKRDLDDVVSPDALEDEALPSCNVVRGRINRLLDAGVASRAEFARAIGCGAAPLANFLGQRGPRAGAASSVYPRAWAWFRQREVAGLKMPDVKKRQRREAEAEARAQAVVEGPGSGSGPAASGSSSRKKSAAAAAAAALPDLGQIHLDGEEEDEVPVYDTCDEVRRKLAAHLRKTPGLTQAQLCRDLYAQLHVPRIKGIQSKQLADFRGGRGARTGARSTIFYAAYVYFEKLRIARGQPKSAHRETMEDLWPAGFERDIDNRTQFIVSSATPSLHIDEFGRVGGPGFGDLF